MKCKCLGLILLAGCRFGGAEGSALAPVDPVVDGGAEAGLDGAPGPTGGGVSPPGSNSPGPASEGGAGVLDAGASRATCLPPESFEGCDPIQNTGCFPLTQCIVDPAGDPMTGQCVLSGVVADAPCDQGPFGTSCPPQHGCVEGQCRKYCACDADCDSGSTCSVELALGVSRSLKACGP